MSGFGVPPPRPHFPPLPDPGDPFDLAALERLDAGPEPDGASARRRWWPRRRPPAAVAQRVTAPRDPRSLLTLVPEPEQCRQIRLALQSAGVSYAIPVRITLLAGLDARDARVWSEVHTIARRHPPFSVRLIGPEVIQDRTVCLRVLGDGARSLQRDLLAAFGDDSIIPDDPRHVSGPTLPLAGTWTEMNRVELHELATGVRNELPMPLEFRASTIYAFEDSADEDLPYREFPLGPASV